MLKLISTLLFIICIQSLFAQNITQNIKGRIIDVSSEEALPFANIIIRSTDPLIGTTTDLDGNFIIENVPIGRYDLEASYLGYEPIIIPEVIVTSAKEVILKVKMKENPNSLSEIVVTPKTTKEDPLNQMALVSARMLSTEEASRYAGGFDDPARLASSFAGVASGVGNNAIIVRGNAPKFLQWKIEGVEIPNPNHFADLNVLGGGGLTALSSNLLANSDFFTGAFPAEYNNAISGVFDIKMRSGNAYNDEHSIELGAIGIDLASEGPLSKNNKSSYLFNYRYSTLGLIAPLLPEVARGTNYQDLSFKFKFQTAHLGVLSFWGLGLIDNSGAMPQLDSTKRYYYQDIEKQDAKQFMGSTGINHRLILSSKTFINSTIAYTTNGLNLKTHRLNQDNILQPQNIIDNVNSNVNLITYINTKFNANHTNRSGLNVGIINYNSNLSEVNNLGNKLINIVDRDGSSALISAYTSSSFSILDWTINTGINSQLFALNNNFTLEPRFGVSRKITVKHKISFGYGLHSRIEALNIYLSNTSNSINSQANRDLDFTKAHHFVLSYDWNITDKIHLKIELYYQRLFDVPSIRNTTISLLNLKNDWFINDTYINNGLGQNYGLDLTIEQYINNGFYYLISASIFQSQYKIDGNKWLNTRFNKSYLGNLLIGKEFRISEKQNLLGLNFKISTQGGERYSPIDIGASNLQSDVVFNESDPFTIITKPVLNIHFTINYEWYKTKTTHKLSLKVLNATNQKEFQGLRYNLQTNQVEEFREALIIPNISYKVSF